MEGSKGRLRRSLGFRLTLLLMILGLVGAIAASTWSYRSMLREAESFVDEELSQIAAIVINYDMLIPRRWEGPRRMHERVFARLHTRQGDVIIASDPQGLGRGVQSEAGIPTLDDLTVKSFDIVIAPLIGRPGDNLYLPITVKDGFYNAPRASGVRAGWCCRYLSNWGSAGLAARHSNAGTTNRVWSGCAGVPGLSG